MTFIRLCKAVREMSSRHQLTEKQTKMLMSEFYLKGKTTEQDIENDVKKLEG